MARLEVVPWSMARTWLGMALSFIIFLIDRGSSTDLIKDFVVFAVFCFAAKRQLIP
jgi:hypothetical protein